MGKKNAKKQQAVLREKKFLRISVIIFLIGVIVLTSVFLYFDIFTYKSVFFEYTEAEIAVNEKIKENSYVAEIDAYGDVIIPKTQISFDTVSYFQIGEYDARILAYIDSNFNYLLGYDSCQQCVSQGRTGWFYENNGYLHCSVCGAGIELSELGSENPSSAIYPIPVTKKMREERKNVLVVPKDVIKTLFNE